MRAALLVLAASTAHASPADDVLARVNRYRAIAGVPAVTLDAKASAGCMEHARYMLLNANTDAMAGLNAHQQRADLPGASPAGAACGKAADLFPNVADLATAVDGWMDSLYHRRPMLSPQLARIGVGYAKTDDGTLMAALMFIDGDDEATGWPVAYPAADGKDIPLEFGSEIPNPVPDNGKGGFPITLEFPPFDKVTDVSATLSRDGKPVPFHLSSPEHPATSFGQYGVICVIPKQRLAANATYTASITFTWQGKPATRTWKFTTLAPASAIDATDEAALLANLGKLATVRGTVRHAGMMDSAHAFLQLGADHYDKFQMVSVIIPTAIWHDDPKTWIGKTVEVEATPQLVMQKYLNLAITEATQLRVARPR